MRGIIISQDQGTYLVSGDDGKRYQFAVWDWLGKIPPKVGDTIDFVCEGNSINSVFPLLSQQSEQSKVMLALICWFAGVFGIHRFLVGRIWTGILMLVLSLSVIGLTITGIWAIVDFIIIIAGKFSDKSGDKIVN
ncbi:TM2 domain-containing protein [Bartonella sp. B35(2025)]